MITPYRLDYLEGLSLVAYSPLPASQHLLLPLTPLTRAVGYLRGINRIWILTDLGDLLLFVPVALVLFATLLSSLTLLNRRRWGVYAELTAIRSLTVPGDSVVTYTIAGPVRFFSLDHLTSLSSFSYRCGG